MKESDKREAFEDLELLQFTEQGKNFDYGLLKWPSIIIEDNSDEDGLEEGKAVNEGKIDHEEIEMEKYPIG